jgi:CDP-2,3-bis-(O-geranylgeranyl)-sn-glycerol synthase
VGAVGGDLLKSFLKRRRRIPPGARWIPADQLDFVIGAIALIAPFAHLTWSDVVAVLLVSFVADIAVNQVAFRLQIRETPW